MARSRSRRRSTLRRVVMPTCAIGFVLLVAYLLMPEGRPDSAQAAPAGQDTLADAASPGLPPKLAAEKAGPRAPGPATSPVRIPATQPAVTRTPPPIDDGKLSQDAEPAAGKLPALPVAPASRPAMFTTPASGLLAEAASLVEAGKLLEARAKLNDALQAGRLDPAGADTVKARIRELNGVMSDYEPDSELMRLCRTAGQGMRVPVSRDLLTVLSRAQALSELSDGAFDVTVGPYVRLWRTARRTGEFPTTAQLGTAREAVGYRHVRLDPDDKNFVWVGPSRVPKDAFTYPRVSLEQQAQFRDRIRRLEQRRTKPPKVAPTPPVLP